MFKFKILFIFVFIGNIALAQDLIVTNKNDSIRCKIDRSDFDFVYYTLNKDNQNTSTKIKLSDVRNVRYNYLESKNQNQNIPSVVEDIYRPERTYRFVVDGGMNLITAKTLSTDDKELDKHLKSLKLGYPYGLGAYMFGQKSFGYGLTYKHYFNQNKNDAYLYVDSVNGNRVGELSDRTNINFYAFTLLNRTSFFNDKMDLFLGISGGY